MFGPVDGKGEKLFVAEIHHGEKRIHEPLPQPPLRILAHAGVGIPAVAAVACEVVVLADGRTAHFHPWLLPLHLAGDLAHDVCDAGPARVATNTDVPRLGITYVVEMDAVDVVAAGDVAAELRQIVARARIFGVHVAVGANPSYDSRQVLSQPPAALAVPLAHGYGDHPRVQFHAPLVALVDGEAQRVVARGAAGEAREAAVPRFVGRVVDGGGAYARLHQHGVDARPAVEVEQAAQFGLLPLHGEARLRVGVGPVDAPYGGEPHGPHLVFGGLRSHRRPHGLESSAVAGAGGPECRGWKKEACTPQGQAEDVSHEHDEFLLSILKKRHKDTYFFPYIKYNMYICISICRTASPVGAGGSMKVGP